MVWRLDPVALCRPGVLVDARDGAPVLIFTAMLFALEPVMLRRRLEGRAAHDTIDTQRTVLRMHWVLLTASLITIAGAVAGSHGWLIWRG
jgi:hypothetical protein